MQKQAELILKLNNGNFIPQIGYGTYQLTKKKCVEGVKYALEIGYKHIDSASSYKNGQDIRFPNRKDIFLTSKISTSEQGYQEALNATQNILSDLDTTYLDLLLIHWPGVAKYKPGDPKVRDIRLQTWKAMEKLYDDGVVKNIGVSNFLKHHLVHLIQNCRIKPQINQIEIHPLCWDKDTLDYCKQENIIIEAYSPLARQDEKLLKNNILLELSKKYNKSDLQFFLNHKDLNILRRTLRFLISKQTIKIWQKLIV
ncbi:hypothetical protein pb186bvf_012489 [Paramecium bursaria]